MNILKHLVTSCSGLVDAGPLSPPSESFLFPNHEGGKIDDGRLHDLFIRKNAPSNSVHCVFFNVGDNVPICVRCLITYDWVVIQMFYEFIDQLPWNKELKVGLLIDIAILGTPAKDWVRGFNAVGYWL